MKDRVKDTPSILAFEKVVDARDALEKEIGRTPALDALSRRLVDTWYAFEGRPPRTWKCES